VLVNLPGESSSVVTCIDGYQMARQGRAGPALAIAAIASFFAGCVATIIIALAAPPLTKVAQQFAAADYFSLMVLGLVFAIVLARGSIIKAVGMIFIGMLLGLVGTDVNTGNTRFTFNISSLFDGIGFVPLAMGVFGIAEIVHNLTNTARRDLVSAKISGLMPTRADIKQSIGPILRGTALGSFLGLLPGGGATLSSFSAYTLEKKISRTPERFGKGAIEGVAAPEAANNAAAQTSFIPMLTLGIPGNSVMALMIGALTIHGIQPGPQVMTQNHALFWGLIASMWIGNLMLVIINLPLIQVWVTLLRMPYRVLYLAILMFCAIGVYSVDNNAFKIIIAAVFGVLGYVFIRLQCDPAPLLLGFVLGPMLEENLRRSMRISSGDPMIFLQRPISAGLLAVAVVLLVITALPAIRKRRDEAFREE